MSVAQHLKESQGQRVGRGPEVLVGARPHPDGGIGREWHLFPADLFIALVLKSLFHGSQRHLPVVLGDVIMEAASRRTHEDSGGQVGLWGSLTGMPTLRFPFVASLTGEGTTQPSDGR